MTDEDVAFFQVAQGVGSLVFFLLLVIVAVQYRRRPRQIKALTQANGALTQQLAATSVRLDEMERWQGRYPPPTTRQVDVTPTGRHSVAGVDASW